MIRAASPSSKLWMAAQTGLAVTGEFRAIEAVDAKGEVHAVVGFDKWTHTSVRIHICGAYFLGHGLADAVYDYVFKQSKKDLMIAEIADSNRRSRRFAARIGFKELARIPSGWAKGDDLIIYTLRKENWMPGRSEDVVRSRCA